MTADFYLFDVDHGQSAVLHLPNGHWCIFDVGCTALFSPIAWISARERTLQNALNPLASLLGAAHFRFLKATVSHYHGDHIADYQRLFQCSPEYLRTVDADPEYLVDCMSSSNDESVPKILDFAQRAKTGFGPMIIPPNYGEITIQELSLPVSYVRQLGGAAIDRVNNASIITRINAYGNSILLCGDMEKEAWDTIIGNPLLPNSTWRAFVSNVDVLVAPHHGHKSAFSVDLLNLSRPAVVLVSVVSRDPNVDSRYSQTPIRGIGIDGVDYKCITTRQKGHIKVTISPPQFIFGAGSRSWSFGDTALN